MRKRKKWREAGQTCRTERPLGRVREAVPTRLVDLVAVFPINNPFLSEALRVTFGRRHEKKSDSGPKPVQIWKTTTIRAAGPDSCIRTVGS